MAALPEINWKNVESGIDYFAIFAIPVIPKSEVRNELIAMVKSALVYALNFRRCFFTPIVPQMSPLFQFLADSEIIYDDIMCIRVIDYIERSNDGTIKKIAIKRRFWEFLSEWGQTGYGFISQRGVKLHFPWLEDCMVKNKKTE